MTNDFLPTPQAFKTIGFMIASLPLRIVAFVLTFVLTVVGISLTPVWVGIPTLLIGTEMTRAFGDLERRWAGMMLGIDLPPVARRPEHGGLVRRWWARICDGATWREFGYALVGLPIGIAEFVLGLTSVALPPIAAKVVPRVGAMHAELATRLLGPRGRPALPPSPPPPPAIPVFVLPVAAPAPVPPAPEPPEEKEDDLATALAKLAASSKVPVELQVDADPPLPAAVAETAHATVLEALVNVGMHSLATAATVKVWRASDTLVVEVTDNGRGEAEVRGGGGLARLADRAATTDGVITVVSPLGGPTVIRADLPCRWGPAPSTR